MVVARKLRRITVVWTAILATAGLAWIASCGDSVLQTIGLIGDDAGTQEAGDAAAMADGAGSDGAHDGGREGGIDGGGRDALVHVEAAVCASDLPIPLPGMGTCASDLASMFRFASCTCASTRVSGRLTTDIVTSAADAQAATVAASVGAGGSISLNGQTSVGGSVWAAGAGLQNTAAVALGGAGSISKDVRAGGSLDVSGTYGVGGDVFAAGDVTVNDPDAESLSVAGAVHVAEAGAVSPGVTAGKPVVVETVQVPTPCDCATPVPIFSIVSTFKNANDDTTIGLRPAALEAPAAPISLPCGSYYVYAVTGGVVDLDIRGYVALFVDGDVNVSGGLLVHLVPGAQLDLFVAGSVGVGGGATLGNLETPGSVRIYVGGSTVQLNQGVSVGANIYAPYAAIALPYDLDMRGALFVNEFDIGGAFGLHYDPSVLAAGGCRRPGGACQTCGDCPAATPACKGGTCQACTADPDCCAPLACVDGGCVQPSK